VSVRTAHPTVWEQVAAGSCRLGPRWAITAATAARALLVQDARGCPADACLMARSTVALTPATQALHVLLISVIALALLTVTSIVEAIVASPE
jgi:hypothetical protein